MGPRNGASFAGKRLEKLAEKQQKAVDQALAQQAASKKRTPEQEYYGEEDQRKKRKGKPKGATHGRSAERETFGSADLHIDSRSLSAAEKASLQPGDDPVRDGVGSLFAKDAPSPGIDPRGNGKNGERVEEGSGSDNSDEENSPLPRRKLLDEAVIGGSQWRERDPRRSPQREAPSVHRTQGDVLAIKSRSGSGSGSAVVEQQLAIRQGKGVPGYHRSRWPCLDVCQKQHSDKNQWQHRMTFNDYGKLRRVWSIMLSVDSICN